MARAETEGLTLSHLFKFEVDEVTSDLDKEFLREFALGENSQLKPREREVLRCRLWEGMTQKAVGKKIGLSVGSVCHLQYKAMRKLRIYLLRADPILAEEVGKIDERRAKERAEELEVERQEELDEQAEREKDLQCPDYVFLKRGVSGELQLEIPREYATQFQPISMALYKKWLEEKSKCPKALKELGECEEED